jgi:predicted MFS family arabinose efflux permease
MITMVVRAADVLEPPAGYTPPFPEFHGVHYASARTAAYAGLLDGLVDMGPDYDFAVYLVGGLVLVLGLISGMLLKEPIHEKPVQSTGFLKNVLETFRWSSLKKQGDLVYLLLAVMLWGIAQQIFFPYLLIYITHFLKIETLQASLIIFLAILLGGIATAYPLGLLVDKWGRKRVALLAILAEMLGLFAFSLARSVPALVITGILWLAPISAWTIATSAWEKDLFPENKRGQFGGYVILFSVALTMVPGPLIGSWLTTSFGIHTILDGKEAYIPTSLIFQAGAFATLLAAIPIFRTQKKSKISNQ